jgi:hypothetical protein
MKKGVELQAFYNWYCTVPILWGYPGYFISGFVFSYTVKRPEFDFDTLFFAKKCFFFFSKICFPIPHRVLETVFRIRDPVSFGPRDPGWVKNQDPDHISVSLNNNFFVKILKFFDLDPGRKKVGSGIRGMSKFGIYVQFTIF